MAGFKTHITTSTAIGVGSALVAHFGFQVPLPACVLAGGLCSVAGMLPDLDSDSGVPLRESIAFAAAAVPMVMVRRWERLGMPFESMVLSGMVVYLLIRFGLAGLLKKYTVHRGMFHSIPAAIIAAEVTFLVFDHENIMMRYFNAGAVLVGFMSHLILDEIWSIGVKRGGVYLKSSSGTAVKFWGEDVWANFATYSKVAVLSYLVSQDPKWMGHFDEHSSGWREMIANQKLPGGATNPLRVAIPRGNESANGTAQNTSGQNASPQYLPRQNFAAPQQPWGSPAEQPHQNPPPQQNWQTTGPPQTQPRYIQQQSIQPQSGQPHYVDPNYIQQQDNPFEQYPPGEQRPLVPVGTNTPIYEQSYQPSGMHR